MRTPEQSGKDVSIGFADKNGYHTYWHNDFPQVQIKIKEPHNPSIVFYLLKKLTEIRADLDPKHPFNINKGGKE